MRLLIPWRSGCPQRRAALGWVWRRYRRRHPEWPIVFGGCFPPSAPWVKAKAVTPWLPEDDEEVVIVADADVWCDQTVAALDAVRRGGAAWAIPHRRVHRLSEEGTRAVLAGQRPERQPLEQYPYPGVKGGGIVVTRAGTLREVPLDPRFVGWGGEDAAWGTALVCLLGEPWRGKEPLYHLWHPPQERSDRYEGSEANRALKERYHAARYEKSAMRSLIEEVTDARTPELVATE